MSKNIRTLSRIATAIVSWANVGASHRATRAALVEQAEHLSHDEKRKVDGELVPTSRRRPAPLSVSAPRARASTATWLPSGSARA